MTNHTKDSRPLCEEASGHWKDVYDYAKRRGFNHQDAEDAAQDTFLAYTRRPPKQQALRYGQRSMVLLIGRRSINSTWRMRLAQKRSLRHTESLSHENCPAAPPDSTSRDSGHLCGLLLRALKHEKKSDMFIVLQEWLNGGCYDAIGRKLRISVYTVTNTLHRARLFLKSVHPIRTDHGEEDLADPCR